MNSEEIKEQPKNPMTEKRRKCLMRKINRIKINKTRANNSFMDLHSLYESKLNSLRQNNGCLAKALAEQRQVSQSWYDEYVTVKSELHETQEKLLTYEVVDTGDFEMALNRETEKRLKSISEPMEAAVKSALDKVVGLAESLSTVKHLFGSLIRVREGGGIFSENLSKNSSRGSTGFRQPFGHTPKSPRKNVVHPMVEGHVFRPAQIKISLADRYQCRLQERAAKHEEEPPNISNISERSSFSNEESHMAAIGTEAPAEEEEDLSPDMDSRLAEESEEGYDVEPEEGCIFSTEKKLEKEKSLEMAKKQRDMMLKEDPLEGPSWLHLKKRRKRVVLTIKKRRQTKDKSLPKLNPSSPCVDDSSDSDDVDYVPPPRSKESEVPKSKEDAIFEELSMRIGRRSNRKKKLGDETNERPLESFIFTDSPPFLHNPKDDLSMEPYLSLLPVEQEMLPHTSLDSTMKTLPRPVKPVRAPFENEEAKMCNITCFLNSSMEMTECLSKDIFNMMNGNTDEKPDHSVNCEALRKRLVTKEQLLNVETKLTEKKFFKSKDAMSISEWRNGTVLPPETAVFDMSRMDPSFNDHSYNQSKENIPPIENQVHSELDDMKLRNVFIVVKDIMKTNDVKTLTTSHASNGLISHTAADSLRAHYKEDKSPTKNICKGGNLLPHSLKETSLPSDVLPHCEVRYFTENCKMIYNPNTKSKLVMNEMPRNSVEDKDAIEVSVKTPPVVGNDEMKVESNEQTEEMKESNSYDPGSETRSVTNSDGKPPSVEFEVLRAGSLEQETKPDDTMTYFIPEFEGFSPDERKFTSPNLFNFFGEHVFKRKNGDIHQDMQIASGKKEAYDVFTEGQEMIPEFPSFDALDFIPRKRRAASKITSLKEPSLIRKLRRNSPKKKSTSYRKKKR